MVFLVSTTKKEKRKTGTDEIKEIKMVIIYGKLWSRTKNNLKDLIEKVLELINTFGKTMDTTEA